MGQEGSARCAWAIGLISMLPPLVSTRSWGGTLQLEDIQRVAGGRIADVRGEQIGDPSWTSASKAGGHGDELFSIDAIGHRESLDGGTQARLPQYAAISDNRGP